MKVLLIATSIVAGLLIVGQTAAWQEEGSLTDREPLYRAEQQTKKLISELEEAKNERERTALEDDLRNRLMEAYDQRIELHQARLDHMKKKMVEMEEQLEMRREAADEMVDLQLRLLMGKARLGQLDQVDSFDKFWQPSPPSSLNPLFPQTPPLSRPPPRMTHRPTGFPSPPTTNDLTSRLFDGEDSIAAIARFTGGEDSSVAAGMLIFGSSKQLRDGKLEIRGISNKRQTLTISFDDEQEDIRAKLYEGEYTYKYEQDGKVWVEGKFVKDGSAYQSLAIESGQPNDELLERHKVAVTFTTGSKGNIDGTLWVRGINSDFTAKEYSGRIEGEIKCKYLPGEYIFALTSDGFAAQTFTVHPDEPMTLDLFGPNKNANRNKNSNRIRNLNINPPRGIGSGDSRR